ncbi:MAG: antirestriction protein ArdA [Defluviitaleaceae bacterium]|nr:antirestriction protein ArdA [Defluviitaleaceae bacterium]
MEANHTAKAFLTIETHQGGSKTAFVLNLPATEEALGEALKSAGAQRIQGNITLDSFYVNADTSYPNGRFGVILGDVTLSELNYLAAKMSELDENNLDKLDAVIESGRHRGTVGTGKGELADIINIIENLDSFELHNDFDEQRYGEYLLSEPGNLVDQLKWQLRSSSNLSDNRFVDLVECLRECADAELFGRSMSYENDGEFLSCGYLIEDGSFYEVYHGPMDIPEKYRIGDMAEPLSNEYTKVENVDLSRFFLKTLTNTQGL